MMRATTTAYPLSQSETLHTFRSAVWDFSTDRTGSRCIGFIHQHINTLPRDRFVFKKGAKHGPGSVERRLGHTSFCQFFCRDISYSDKTVFRNKFIRHLVGLVTPPVCSLSVYGFDTSFFVVSLCFNNGCLSPAIEVSTNVCGTVRACCEDCLPRVYTYFTGTAQSRVALLNNEIQIPSTSTVLGDVPGLNSTRNVSRLPKVSAKTEQSELVLVDVQVLACERDPPQRSTTPPTKLDLLSACAVHRILVTDTLNSLRRNAEVASHTFGHLSKLEPVQKSSVADDMLVRHFVNKVPHDINTSCHAAKPCAGRVFDSVAVGSIGSCHLHLPVGLHRRLRSKKKTAVRFVSKVSYNVNNTKEGASCAARCFTRLEDIWG